MVTAPAIEAKIPHCYHVEKWLIDIISGQLHVHRSVVTRLPVQAGCPGSARQPGRRRSTRWNETDALGVQYIDPIGDLPRDLASWQS